MPVVDVKVYYLEMFAHKRRTATPPRDGLAVIHAKKPTVAYYRFLYDAVGRDYDWTSRKELSDHELAALLHDPRLDRVLLGQAAGGATPFQDDLGCADSGLAGVVRAEGEGAAEGIG